MKILESVILVAEGEKKDLTLLSGKSIPSYSFAPEEIETRFDVTGWHRSTAKDTLIALRAYESLKLDGINPNESRIGLFGAFSNGPLNYDLVNAQTNFYENSAFNELYSRWPPRQHFIQSAPMKLSHLSLVKKFQDPMFCFTDALTCFEDSLLVAVSELEMENIDYAVVLSAYSLVEPQVKRLYAGLGAEELRECGIALLIGKNRDSQENEIDDHIMSRDPAAGFNFGYCSNFIFRSGKKYG